MCSARVYRFAEVKKELQNSNCIQTREDDEELDWFLHALDEEFIETKMKNDADQMLNAVEGLLDKQQGLKTKPQVHICKILAALVFKDASGLGTYNLHEHPWCWSSLFCLLARSLEMSQRSEHQNRGEIDGLRRETCQNSSYQMILSLAIDGEVHNNAVLNLLESPLSKQVLSVIDYSIYSSPKWNMNQDVIVSMLRVYGTMELVGSNPRYLRLNHKQIRLLSDLIKFYPYQVTCLVLQMRDLVLGLFRVLATSQDSQYFLPYQSSKVLRDLVRQDGRFSTRMLEYGDEVPGVIRFLDELLAAFRIESGEGSRENIIRIMVFLLEILIGLGQYQHAVNTLETLRQLFPEGCKEMDAELLLYARIKLADWNGLLHDLDLIPDPAFISYLHGFEREGLMMRLKEDFAWEGLDKAIQLLMKGELVRNGELEKRNTLLELSERLLLDRANLRFLHDDTVGARADLDYLTKAEEESSQVTNHNWSFYTQRGIIRRHMGDYARALKDFEKAIQLGEYQSTFSQLAYVKFLMGDEVGARADLDGVTETDSGFFYQERGVVKRLMGDLPGALEDLNKACLLDTDDYEILKQRGYVRFLLKDQEGAQSDAEKAFRCRPDRVNEPGSIYKCFGTSIVEFLGYQL